jgi:hypothetical protein
VNYLFYRRIKGPVFLLTFGVTAALAEWHVLGFEKSWPLYLIVFGVLRLAEGAALSAMGQAPFYATPANMPFQTPAQGYAPHGTTYQAAAPVPGSAPGTALATVAPSPIQRAATTEEES